MSVKKEAPTNVEMSKSIDISERSEDVSPRKSNEKPRFRQNGRCCWGGCSKCLFISMLLLAFLAIFAAIAVPVFFIPLANLSVDKTIKDSHFTISKLEIIDRKIDFANPNATNYVIMNAEMDITHLHDSAKGAQVQPASVFVAYQGKTFGEVALPYVDLQVPDSTVATTTTLYISDPITALTAIACSRAEVDPCTWTVLGTLVIKKKLAATTMYYGSDLNNKTVSFELDPESHSEPAAAPAAAK